MPKMKAVNPTNTSAKPPVFKKVIFFLLIQSI